MIKRIVLTIGILFLAGIMMAQETDYRIKERIVPDEYKDTYRFLEILKWDTLGSKGYQQENAPLWNVDSVAAYISADGVDCSDPNMDYYSNLPKTMIIDHLRNRVGVGFEFIAHLSYIYSIPYKQYSELSFEATSNASVIVRLASVYKLTFVKVRSRYYLKACEYLVFEGE